MDQEEFDKKLDEILRSKDKDVGKLFAKKFLQGAPLSTSFSKTTTPFHLPHISIKSGTKGNEKPPRKNYIQGLESERLQSEEKLLETAVVASNIREIPLFRRKTKPTGTNKAQPVSRTTDLMALVKNKVQKFTDNSYVYLTYAVPKSSEFFTPYSLIEVPFNEVDKTEYYTLSRHGITYWGLTENYFTKLDIWLVEYNKYSKLRDIKTFYNYRLWKGFIVWRKSVVWHKFKGAAAFLATNLFQSQPLLNNALLKLNYEYGQLENYKFVNIAKISNMHLFYFIENQMESYEVLRDLLLSCRQNLKDVLYAACYAAIKDRGFMPEDEALYYTSVKQLKEIMSFTECSRKEKYLARLAKFLSLADYMTITLLLRILVRTFEDFAYIFKIHNKLAPTNDEVLENAELEAILEKPRPEGPVSKPFFTTELLVNVNGIFIDPSREVTQSIVQQLHDLIMKTIDDVKRYQSDPVFTIFTDPSIVGKRIGKLCGKPPDLYQIIEINLQLMDDMASISKSLDEAYDKFDLYIKRYDSIFENYKIEALLDIGVIKNETEIEILRSYLNKYSEEMRLLDRIRLECNLGMFHIDQEDFKQEIIAVCSNLMSILDATLPRLARSKLEALAPKVDNFLMKLATIPKDTYEIVRYLFFVDHCTEDFEKLQVDLGEAYRIFQVIKEFDVLIDFSEKDRYFDMEELLVIVQENMVERIADKQRIIGLLAKALQGDIAKLFAEVAKIREEITLPFLIDENTEITEAQDFLNTNLKRLQELQALSQEYRKFQKDFKIEVTRFDTLDQTLGEVKFRLLLWESQQQWDEAMEEWYAVPFNTLVMDDIATLNTKIIKSCVALEKNIPKNEIVPKLKERAENFKEKIAALTVLRNPTLRKRHWVKIEGLINRKIPLDDSLTLGLFDDAKMFAPEHLETLLEIAGQASAEAGLEVLLKKVDDLWKEFELTVTPHRDSKDVFILAGQEDLQTALDESNINISTVAASRFVGPIKPRVDNWVYLLDHFAETFDEWITCQMSWVYLEAIFSAPDIQRQLPKEAKMFMVVDKNWKEIMRKVAKVPLAQPHLADDEILNTMKENNKALEHINRSLEAYLEVKRVAFPRFFFLSNDELLEILAQTQNPHAVQPHLRKCFDAIATLDFGTKEGEKEGEIVMTNDIIAMNSPEGEKVVFGRGLKARGPVEDWLGKTEKAMFIALKRCMKYAYTCYSLKDRSLWCRDHANQIVLTVSQQKWAVDVHAILDKPDEDLIISKMKDFEAKLFKDLTKLAAIARTDISKILRRVLCALITIDVHAKDTITNMVKNQIVKSSDFDWLKMLRYYWNPDTELMLAKMASACLPYFYEYLGAGGVLVITPLTDRCYLCLMGALQMDLGGAPAGPAGTGKTETTKDLAKALAIQCVVFNCSDGLDYKMMGRFFSGLATSGAWCCFDEFNRIGIEVLSVIAQQLITIRNAKHQKQKRFMFEGREIALVMSCSAFITMNPGYAGRTELPDNLKALFRPISMMVPDYALIAEVILYSEGFENSRILAQKMVQMYKLCSEQLSQQDHYDFGMRAVKSVLVMAGALKRASPDQIEDITLICALRDSNLPKFLSDDAGLFKGILGDLFPGIDLPVVDYGKLQEAIEFCMAEVNLQLVPELIAKNIQLYETMAVRWGVMLVGPTGSGKTKVLHTLGAALGKLWRDGVDGVYYRNVVMRTMNPKSISSDELYGAVNLSTMEWKDGLLGLAVRAAVNVKDEEHQWVVCDGPVDAVWIENLNTVLDDNKMLCLANSERIKLTAWVHMVFEVQDLAQASPATVSRCGMVYIDPLELGWLPLVKSWIVTLTEYQLRTEYKDILINLFKTHFEKILIFVRRKCKYSIHQVEVSKLSMMLTLLQALIKTSGINNSDILEARSFLHKIFIWCTLWSIGGNLMDESRVMLESLVRSMFKDNQFSNIPDEDLWSYRVNTSNCEWESWASIVPVFEYNPNIPFFDMLVPTTDTARFGQVAELLFKEGYPVMFTGDTGVGKSVLGKAVLLKLQKLNVIPVFLNFSAQTSSPGTQDLIEARLERRKKTLLGAPMGKKLIYFVDDVNMPKLDTYGSQATIELLRQFLDFKGLYDRDKWFFKNFVDVILGAACAPPGGGRNPLTPRFVRHFGLLLLPPPSNLTLTAIFEAIMVGFLADFAVAIRELAIPIVQASVIIYERILNELLPTPAKSHYVFNLRDLSKCIQGVLQADSSNYSTLMQVQRLFYHEVMRVFHDRLVDDIDKGYFKNLLGSLTEEYFGMPIVKEGELILFGDFMIFGQAREDRIYEEIKDMNKLRVILLDYLDDYNGATGQDMKLILFEDAVEHILRLARLLRSERGNGLLVGVSGMGKQSLSRLASHLNGYKCYQIELSRGYNHASFHEDMRKFYFAAGVANTPSVFLMTDTQIIQEDFLEDVNNILNSGEVPNLFESDEYEKLMVAARQPATDAKHHDLSRDGIYHFFIGRVRSNLHVVLCMSPVGDAFRRRCRMFPSLVNCCTIDWFVKWPPEALYSVAMGSLKSVTVDEVQCDAMSQICVSMHESVEDASDRFAKEMRRHYYTTPSSYLELLKQYHELLKKRKETIYTARDRISNGLEKILETNELVFVMGEAQEKSIPMLEEKHAKTKLLVEELDKDNKKADQTKRAVAKDEAEAMIIKEETQVIAIEAEKELAVALPALLAAEDALKALNKSDVNELRVFQKPPKLVQFVMEAVCLLLGAKTDWNSAKMVMADVNFLKKLKEYDKEHIPQSIQNKIQAYVNDPNFTAQVLEKVSKVAKSMCLWVIAIDKFAKVYKNVEPKIKARDEARASLKKVVAVLKIKQQQLAEIEALLRALMDSLEEQELELQDLQDDFDLTSARLNRANRLTSALSDEEVRWKQTVEHLTKELWTVPGDVLVASGCVAYLGAFPINYRKEIVVGWVHHCKSFNIPSSEVFNIVRILGDPYQMRVWNMHGLPRDDVSIENGIIVTQSGRWPLMIDPQEQANRWIRSMELPNGLRITKLNDPNMMRIMEVCIRQGLPVLLEEVEETLDPSLGPILSRAIVNQGGRLLIRLGDTDVDYDANFKLYMTSKLSNPHYLPEICIQVTLVNFLVSLSGLEDQLLADVVRIELPALEKQRVDLIVRINQDQQTQLMLEDKILKTLQTYEGNILDDEDLIDMLNETKLTSTLIEARLIEAEKTEAHIVGTREKYRPLAARGAILFFVVAGLAEIDPMYQFSLRYFSQVFCAVIEEEAPKMELAERLTYLMDAEIYAIYANISRGLFEKHKLIYSFLLAVAVSKQLGDVTDIEFDYLLRGPVGTKAKIIPKPAKVNITDNQWVAVLHLQHEFPNFDGIVEDVDKRLPVKLDDLNIMIECGKPPHRSAAKDWNTLSSFQKLMLVATLRDQILVNAIGSYVRSVLGKRFTEAPQNTTLVALYQDISPITPLVFVLSTGSDPMSALLRFAQERNYLEKLHSISLGQGQGPAAEGLLEKGRKDGHWIFLQNCHLATSWMDAMEKKLRDVTLGVVTAHADYRLFLSSMPAKTFPVSVLQNSVKVTNEPPKGLRANLIGALNDITPSYFENHILGKAWKSMIFGICMFHGVILERRKFGALGWNITYEFTESDRECALRTLDMFCSPDKPGKIPWDALEYINGEITYGGRVTDSWDLRCLRTILKTFSSSRILVDNYKYSETGIYRFPNAQKLEAFREYASSLPFVEIPEIFGMHENANLVFQTKETRFYIETLLEGQPRVSGGEGAASSDDICLEMIEKIRLYIPRSITTDDVFPALTIIDSKGRVPSLTTVMFQEVERFNRMLSIIHDSLANLQKAIKGFIVMSENLEEIFHSFLNNQVPPMWHKRGFLSTKSLGNWILDFQLRLEYMQAWVNNGLPKSSWICGLFFPQSFITGTLQTHARKHNLPIDSLKIDFEVLKPTVIQSDVFDKRSKGMQEGPDLYNGLDHPETGIYVHGLFIEGGRWDPQHGGLCDAKLGELTPRLPALCLVPCLNVEIGHRYETPLYKTSVRAGVLSTTGHSTNFVLTIFLPSHKPGEFWILRGTALITLTTD